MGLTSEHVATARQRTKKLYERSTNVYYEGIQSHSSRNAKLEADLEEKVIKFPAVVKRW